MKGEHGYEADYPSDAARELPGASLTIRRATLRDVDGVTALSRRIYHPMPGLTEQMIRGQINNFPDGQFVAVHDGKIVGYCATFVIAEPSLLVHIRGTKSPVTALHRVTTSVALGSMEWMFPLTPSTGRLRIGQRLYNARKALAKELGLKGIAFGGRMPGLSRKLREVGSAEVVSRGGPRAKAARPCDQLPYGARFRAYRRTQRL